MAGDTLTTVRRQGSSWRHQLQQAWLQRGPLAITLWPISWLYGTVWAVRTLLYRLGIQRCHRLPVPVVVVGNVVVPLAGLPLGHDAWSMVHFGIGAFFWHVVFTLLVVLTPAFWRK